MCVLLAFSSSPLAIVDATAVASSSLILAMPCQIIQNAVGRLVVVGQSVRQLGSATEPLFSCLGNLFLGQVEFQFPLSFACRLDLGNCYVDLEFVELQLYFDMLPVVCCLLSCRMLPVALLHAKTLELTSSSLPFMLMFMFVFMFMFMRFSLMFRVLFRT